MNLKPDRLQEVTGAFEHKFNVIHDQQTAAATGDRLALLRGNRDFALHGRNENPKCSALSNNAFYFNESTALADNAMHDRKTESRPFAGFLGGEERVENSRHDFFGNSRASIRHVA